jgi:hypothetical protein
VKLHEQGTRVSSELQVQISLRGSWHLSLVLHSNFISLSLSFPLFFANSLSFSRRLLPYTAHSTFVSSSYTIPSFISHHHESNDVPRVPSHRIRLRRHCSRKFPSPLPSLLLLTTPSRTPQTQPSLSANPATPPPHNAHQACLATQLIQWKSRPAAPFKEPAPALLNALQMNASIVSAPVRSFLSLAILARPFQDCRVRSGQIVMPLIACSSRYVGILKRVVAGMDNVLLITALVVSVPVGCFLPLLALFRQLPTHIRSPLRHLRRCHTTLPIPRLRKHITDLGPVLAMARPEQPRHRV